MHSFQDCYCIPLNIFEWFRIPHRLIQESFEFGRFKISYKTCSYKCNRWPKPIRLERFCIPKILVFTVVLLHVHKLFSGYDKGWNHMFSILPLVTARKLACNNTILSIYLSIYLYIYMYFPVPILPFELLHIMPLEAMTSSICNVVCLAMTLWTSNLGSWNYV